MEFVSTTKFSPTSLDKRIRTLQLEFANALEVNDVEAIEQILSECHKSLAVLGKLLFPDRFRLPYTKQHMAAFEVLDDESIDKVAIIAFRGWGKTSVVTLPMMGRGILFRLNRFIPYVSKTETHAVLQTENLKRELLTSQIIRSCFGSIKTKKFDDMDETFSKKSWVASLPGDDDFQTLVLPRGEGQRIRGVLFGHYRPDFIQIDDYEDEEFIANESYRIDCREYLYGSLLESVAQAEEEGISSRVVYTDTIKHHNCLPEELAASKDWVVLRFPACDDNYRALVPSFVSQKRIDQKVESYREKGQLNIMAREMMCRAIAKETQAFKEEMFQRYSETDKWFIDQRDYLRSVVIFDPARTYSGNKTGLVCWSVNVETNAMFLRIARAEHWHPEQVIQEAFRTADRYRAYIIGYEDTGLNEWIDMTVRNEMVRLGKQYELVPLKAKRFKRSASVELSEDDGKPGRSGALLQFYRQGQVYHNVVGTNGYELSLLEWPRPKEWDIIDAASYIVPIMDTYTWYFLPTSSGDDPYEFDGEYEGIRDYGDMKENEATYHFV